MKNLKCAWTAWESLESKSWFSSCLKMNALKWNLCRTSWITFLLKIRCENSKTLMKLNLPHALLHLFTLPNHSLPWVDKNTCTEPQNPLFSKSSELHQGNLTSKKTSNRTLDSSFNKMNQKLFALTP